MANRAQKNRLRHGYHVDCSVTGPAMRYVTTKPPFTSQKGSKSRGSGYKNVVKPVREKPKIGHKDDQGNQKWKPRHPLVRREKKES